jgi:hypothetical protein
MKKASLFAVAMFVFMAVFSQQQITPNPKFKTVKAPAFDLLETRVVRNADYQKQVKPAPPEKSIDFVNIINIGTTNNAYGNAGHKQSVLWADDNLKAITHFHQLGGYLQGNPNNYGYDISTDGGVNWSNQNFCISGLPHGLRYPHHGIFNPPGNTDPNEAYIVFFGPCLDQSNSIESWGGYYYGRMKIGDPADTTVHIKPSHGDFYQNIPSGFCITRTGEVWVADLSQDWSSGTLVYQGNAIINHGVWNEETMDFEYDEFLIACPTIDNTRPADQKIAFAPDGMTGYMAVIADNGVVPISAGRSYFPIFWKTTDAGETWEGPISVPIAGPDGIDEIKNFLTNDELIELYGYLPDRNTIEFTSAYDFDLHVDYYGHPHIAVVIGITGEDPYSIVTAQSQATDFMFAAAFDITIENYPTENWFGYKLGRLKTFRGTFGDITEDNRIQIASSWDGLYMIITWGDTDLPGVYNNQQPDIYCRGVDVVTHWMTGNSSWEDMPYNVTEFSEGMWQSYFHNLSHYVFKIENSDRLFTVPLTYLEMNPEDPASPVQFKYISDFVANFQLWGISDSQKIKEILNVSECFPNPAANSASVAIDVFERANIDITICNVTGQIIFELPQKSYPSGKHPIALDVSGFGPGVYFLTISSQGSKVSRKMIVE